MNELPGGKSDDVMVGAGFWLLAFAPSSGIGFYRHGEELRRFDIITLEDRSVELRERGWLHEADLLDMDEIFFDHADLLTFCSQKYLERQKLHYIKAVFTANLSETMFHQILLFLERSEESEVDPLDTRLFLRLGAPLDLQIRFLNAVKETPYPTLNRRFDHWLSLIRSRTAQTLQEPDTRDSRSDRMRVRTYRLKLSFLGEFTDNPEDIDVYVRKVATVRGNTILDFRSERGYPYVIYLTVRLRRWGLGSLAWFSRDLRQKYPESVKIHIDRFGGQQDLKSRSKV